MAAPPSPVDENGILYLSDDEVKSLQYWALVKESVFCSFDRVASDQVYGFKNVVHSNHLMILSQLEMFLSIISEERMWDKTNSLTGFDKGSNYYIEENCIVKIKKSLACKMDKSLIHKIFDIFELYDLNNIVPAINRNGLGFMGIETMVGNRFVIS